MDMNAGNGVERKKHTHLISQLFQQNLDLSVDLLHMLHCFIYGGYTRYILAGANLLPPLSVHRWRH